MDCALTWTGLWRDLVNAWELKVRKVGGNFALLGFSHTKNQVKMSTITRRCTSVANRKVKHRARLQNPVCCQRHAFRATGQFLKFLRL